MTPVPPPQAGNEPAASATPARTASRASSLRGLDPLREVLPNGAVIIAKAAHTTPAVTVHAALRAGTAFDPAHLPGVAHFVSRTIDRGTMLYTGDQIADALESRGVTLSATVNRHVLSLVCTCLAEDFSDVLALLAEILMHPTFPPAEVDTRRGEIATLIRQDQDNPAAVAVEHLMTRLYGEAHPYGRSPRGTLDSIAGIDGPALQAFHARCVRPGALSLAIVGDCDRARAIAAAAEAFGGWKAAPAATADFPEPPSRIAREVEIVPMMNKAQTDVAYGFTTITRDDPAYYAYWLMNNVLGQYSLGGRLGDSIRERQGMAYYVFSSLDANVVPGPLMVRAGVSPANVERTVASIDAELARFAAEGPTEREVTDSKQYLTGSMPRNLETNAGIAAFLQTAEFFGLGLDHDLRMPELLGAVTREQVHEAARRSLDPSRAVVVVAGPYDGPLQ